MQNAETNYSQKSKWTTFYLEGPNQILNPEWLYASLEEQLATSPEDIGVITRENGNCLKIELNRVQFFTLKTPRILPLRLPHGKRAYYTLTREGDALFKPRYIKALLTHISGPKLGPSSLLEALQEELHVDGDELGFVLERLEGLELELPLHIMPHLRPGPLSFSHGKSKLKLEALLKKA